MSTEYGKRLKQARAHAGLTQVQLSEKTGIPQSTISTAERKGHGSSETVVYAKICRVDAHWLATGDGEMGFVGTHEAPIHLQPAAPTVRYIGILLAEKLKPMDRSSREVAAVMLKAIAERPEDPHKMIDALASLLGEFETEHMDSQINRSHGN